MSVLLVIPARFASARFPGKPLVPLVGATGRVKSLVQRSWEAARAAGGVARVVVATDDERIAAHATGFGAEVVMTPASCRNGTERCAAVAELLPQYELIVNLQGDAPLTPPWFVEALITAARTDDAAAMATPVLRCGASAIAGFLEDRRHGRIGGTTAVFGREGRALYFSKEVLPHIGSSPPAAAGRVFHHVGLYAYRREPLLRYPDLEAGALEACEGLEQLRFLEHGLLVRCIEVEPRGRTFWEVNNPEDVPRVEAALAELQLD